MPDPRTVADRSGRLFTLVFLACIGLLGFGLYLQHVKALDPCPLCVLQRMEFMLLALVALTAALHRPGRLATRVYAGLGFLAAAAGAATAGYQIWLQRDPVQAAKCGNSPVERMLDELAVGRIIPPLLQYDGPCTPTPWSLVGLSIPEWALVWFVVLAIGCLAIPFLANR